MGVCVVYPGIEVFYCCVICPYMVYFIVLLFAHMWYILLFHCLLLVVFYCFVMCPYMVIFCRFVFYPGMGVFLHNVTFHGVLLDALFDENNCDWEDVSRLLTKGIEEGAVRPLMTRTFERDDLEEAFRFMAQGKHIGKVLLKVRYIIVKVITAYLNVIFKSMSIVMYDVLK